MSAGLVTDVRTMGLSPDEERNWSWERAPLPSRDLKIVPNYAGVGPSMGNCTASVKPQPSPVRASIAPPSASTSACAIYRPSADDRAPSTLRLGRLKIRSTSLAVA